MTARQKCPDCRQWLVKNSNECHCGWVSANSNFSYEIDHQCVFAASGQRCPLDGEGNISTHGGGTWYCMGHLRNLHDKERCWEILMDAIKNFEDIMEARIDWRIRLIPDEYSVRRKQISQLYYAIKK